MKGPIVYDRATGTCQLCLKHHRWRLVSWLHWRWLCSPAYNWLGWYGFLRRNGYSWWRFTWVAQWWRKRRIEGDMRRVFESPEFRAAVHRQFERGSISRVDGGFTFYEPPPAGHEPERGQ